jgi:hypothetical protein
MMNENTQVINAFWTGGMDSTFNLIQRLLTTTVPVQPHYIVRHEDSTGIEIDTMITIRRAVVAKFPELRSRFLPTIYTNEDTIPRSREVDKEIEALKKQVKINEQYQILAHYCREFKIEQIDLSYELDVDTAPDEILIADFFGKPGAFKSFINPLETVTKRDCYKIAKDGGWSDLILLTSFCRRPRKKITPCGVCGTCSDTVRNGMGFRLPVIPRIKANMLMPFRNYWRKNKSKQKQNRYFKLIQRRFEGKL